MPPDAARDPQRPSWQPDPTGRHDYRWWTGVDWSDQVGDRGVVSIDAGIPPLVNPRSTDPAAYRRRRVLAGAVVGAVVVAAVAGVAWSRRTTTPFGASTLTLDQTTGTAERAVTLQAGEVVRMRIEPSTRIDSAIHVVVDDALALELAVSRAGAGDDPDAYADRVFRNASDVFAGSGAATSYAGTIVVATIDSGSVGRPDAGWFTAATAGEYRFVAAVGSGRAAGPVRSILERHDVRFVPDEADPDRFYATTFFTEAAFYDATAPYASAD